MPPSVGNVSPAAAAASPSNASAAARSAQQQSLGGGQQQQALLSSLQLQQAIDLKVGACRILATLHYLEAHKTTTISALFKGWCPSVMLLTMRLLTSGNK